MFPRRRLTNPLKMLLDAVQRRFRRARPGSVLIMVVSLLVLLALIGTAAMSTARVDREASRQHVVNVQIEMLLEGLKQVVIAEIAVDAYASGPGGTDGLNTDPYEGDPNPHDAFLGSPTPTVLWQPGVDPSQNNVLPKTASGDNIVWQSVSYPPFKNTTGAWQFQPPDYAT